jgi:cytochrome c oxidase subunit 2
MGGRVGEVKVFYVPESAGIQLRMTSKDVIHSFWVPDWRIKCDIFPNRYTAVWFETEALDPSDPAVQTHPDKDPNSVGQAFEERYIYQDHMVYCAEYCGDFHSEMMGIVRVVPREVYAAWVNDPGIDWLAITGLPGGKPLWEVGQLLYTVKGCSSCHTIDGTGGTGPTWDKTATTGWGTMVPLADGSTVLFDENYVRTSVYSPAVQIHRGFTNGMTVFTPDGLNERELGALMALMMHLADIEMDPSAAASIAGGGAATITPPAPIEGTPPGPDPQPAPAAP